MIDPQPPGRGRRAKLVPSDGPDNLLRHHVREGVAEMILGGRFRPAQKLSQQHLAKQFGVGAGVVREALIELSAHGLVDTFDNRGAFVSQLNPKRLLEAFDIRELHEGFSARLCCLRASRAQVHELRDLAQQQRDLSHRDFAAGMKLDRSLHRTLLEIANHRMLSRLAQQYQMLTKVFHVGHEPFATYPRGILRDPDEVYEDHMGILHSIEAGEQDEAERRMRQHIRVGKQEAQSLVDAGLVLHWLDS